MPYTEIKERNRIKYFYRVLSVRNGKKVSKKRVYLGKNLKKDELIHKENEADKRILSEKINNKLEEIKSKIIPILKKNKVKKAGIFGSYAKGEQTKNSDIDILVEPSRGMGFAFVGLQIQLEKALKKKVDLVSYNGLSPHLKDRILKEEVKII